MNLTLIQSFQGHCSLFHTDVSTNFLLQINMYPGHCPGPQIHRPPVPVPINPMYVRLAQQRVLYLDYTQFASPVRFYDNSTTILCHPKFPGPSTSSTYEQQEQRHQPSRHGFECLAST